ncbi:MAG: tetratricopeptide repeat protein [Chloroflexota bacterium]
MYTKETIQQQADQAQAASQANKSPQATIRWTPGIRLQPSEVALLRLAFPPLGNESASGRQTIFVEREFRSGYSGALVLLVSLNSAQAPIVVKLAHPHDLQREYNAYHEFVEKSAPQNTARLQGAPISAADGQLGALLYTFAGGDTHLPTSNLTEYIETKGSEATVAMLNRLFRVYGRHWWAINRAEKFVLGEHYDHLLPVHLEMTLSNAAQSNLEDSRLDQMSDATPHITFVAGENSVVDIRTLQIGDRLELQNFVVAKTKLRERTVTLRADPPEGEAAPPVRIRLLWDGDITVEPGDRMAPIQGHITATRLSLLRDAARGAMPTYAAEKESFSLDITSVRTQLHGVTVDQLSHLQMRNPLHQLDTLLDRVVEARFSTVHGDLNLNNVLIDAQTGFAWLIDFADTTVGPTLFDLQRLEVQLFIKLLPPQFNSVTPSGDDTGQYGAASTALLLTALHADPPAAESPIADHEELYTLLVGIRRLARQYLMDDLDWDEYYLGLMVALVGALKFDELDNIARTVALTAAATVKGLLGVSLFPTHHLSNAAAQSMDAEAPPVRIEPLPEIAPPPEPQPPPMISGFVGREDELIYFSDKLKTERMAVISGMAGVGKTALAATLVSAISTPERIFWHSFHEGEDSDGMVRKLAAFLAWHGKPDLWRLLESARQSGGQPPSTDTILDYLIQLLSGETFLLCFDDYHFVADDLTLNQLITRLQSGLTNQTLSLVLTTRRMPDFVPLTAFEPLSGLVINDARRLLTTRGLQLERDELNELHTLTAGNAQFLILAVNILQQAQDPSLLIERLSTTDDIERYLLTAVDEGLSGAERSVMGAVSIFLNSEASRDAIEAVLNSGNVWRTLRLLNERHLLSAFEGEFGREYRQHAIVQSFYYQELSRRQRRIMHHRAGDYYAEEEIDLLRSGIHYERAAAYELAAKQATADVWWIINRGQARVLRRLLGQFRGEQLDAERWAEVNIAKGTNFAFLDDRDQAGECYQAALATLKGLSSSQRISKLTAQICRGMGELLELENPEEALTWLERGLEQVQLGSEESASLQIKRGTSQMYLAQYEEAKASLETGLQALSESPSQLRSLGLMNLGSVFFFTGDLQQALYYYEQSLAISQSLYDQFRIVNILSNIGIATYCSGAWQAAIDHFQEALALAESLGSEQLQAEVEINLGAAFINTGEDDSAFAHLNSSLHLAQKNGLQVIETFAKYRLADLQIRLGEWAAAAIMLSKAEQFAQQINHRGSLIAIHRAWAELKLAQQDVEGAHSSIEQSIELAQSLQETLERASSLRVLGLVSVRRTDYEQALASFEESLALLTDEDPYEAARTMAALGMFLADYNNEQSAEQGTEWAEEPNGRQLMQRALSRFTELGAQRDAELLKNYNQ